MPYSCTECGGWNVDGNEWRNLNTGEYTGQGPIDNYFCNDCDREVDVKYWDKCPVCPKNPGRVDVCPACGE